MRLFKSSPATDTRQAASRLRFHIIASVLIAALCNCGGQVTDTASSTLATGGTSSSGTGGAAAGTTSTPGPDPTYCNGILLSMNCGTFHRDSSAGPIGCDVELDFSPTDTYLSQVYVDCALQPLANGNHSDAGASEGFLIDYEYEPAHLVLLGQSCDLVQSPGTHTVDLLQGCQCAC